MCKRSYVFVTLVMHDLVIGILGVLGVLGVLGFLGIFGDLKQTRTVTVR